MKKLYILLVGHYTHDIIVDSAGKRHETQGGPPSYMTPFLKALNINFKIVSKIGEDFKYSDNLHHPVDVSDKPTTAWFSDYTKSERVMKFTSVCESIRPEDIQNEATVMIACGVANEIMPETIEKMRKNSKYLLCDIQGFCRRVDENNVIYHIDPMKTWFKDYVRMFDFIKVSSSEAKFVDVEAMRNETTVLLTKGYEGCAILTKGKAIDIQGFPEKEIDPTGAGDVFLAAFAYGLLKGKSAEESAKIGNYAGALAVKYIGMPKITREDIRNVVFLK